MESALKTRQERAVVIEEGIIAKHTS